MSLELLDWVATHGLAGGAMLATVVLWRQYVAAQEARIADWKAMAEAMSAATDKVHKTIDDVSKLVAGRLP